MSTNSVNNNNTNGLGVKWRSKVPQELKDDVDTWRLDSNAIDRMMSVMEKEMKRGMSKDPDVRKTSSLQMETTYVRDLVDGTEYGDYLALDLGGTNFRVLHLTLTDGKLSRCISKNYKLPKTVLRGTAVGLFDHLAESIAMFLESEGIKDRRLPLGFTFSFPMVQESIRKGILVTWTKSFKCQGGPGEDAVRMLEEAIERRGDIEVDILAILNDTTGTLMAGAYLDHRCQIGLILGTGSNASYVEHLENIDKWDDDYNEPKQVIVDLEWGAFGDNGVLDFIRTPYDRKVDELSNHPGSFTFEKYFAGHYMGEIVRCVLEKYARDGILFSGHLSEKLVTHGEFTTTDVSNIEKDEDDLRNTMSVIDELGLGEHATEQDAYFVRYVCEMVSVRSAEIIATALSVLLHHIKKPEVTIAIDGSLYRYHPKLKGMMEYWLKKLCPSTKTTLIVAEDGSGKGAGLVAAVVDRMRNVQIVK